MGTTMLLLVGLLAILSTTLGGYFAMKSRDTIHLILGFTAGAVMAVALFDLLPEALQLGQTFYDFRTIVSMMAFGFIAYMTIDRLISADDHEEGGHSHSGHLGAGSLTIHSFFDGLAIGLAFQVSSIFGGLVATGVLLHDFSDGINTVNMSSFGGLKETITKRWLFADALAPLLGIGATRLFTVPQNILALILSLFAGFFLYIGASQLVPESYHKHPKFWTSFMTLLGMIVLYVAIRIAG